MTAFLRIFTAAVKNNDDHVSEFPVELDEDGDDAVPVLGFRHRKLGRNVLHEELQQEKVPLEVERSIDELMIVQWLARSL